MKLTQEAKTFETNAQVTSSDFTIGDVSVVIEILRNKLYRHKIRTLVQEYISNARDAMREINSQERIQVTLPTVFSPTFKVRDFGPGISPDRMYNVFIKYAASTKRTDNKQTGGFGIGAKSAWSYTESFSIVTHIDGVQRTYVAHIGANNNGRLDHLGDAPTTEKNGTEIQIAVSPKDVTEFRRSAFRAAFFWKQEEQPDFLNVGNEPRKLYQLGERFGVVELNSNIPDYVIQTYADGMVIVIDGIPYVAESSLIEKIEPLKKLQYLLNKQSGRLVFHFNTGDVEVSASREEIADSQMSIEKLTKIADVCLRKINVQIAQEFRNVKSPYEHLQVYMKLQKMYRLDNFKKCGEFTINDRNAIESDLFANVKVVRCDKNYKGELEKTTLGYSRSYYSRIQLHPDTFEKLYFTNSEETILTTNHRLRELVRTEGFVILFEKKQVDKGEFDKVIKALGAKDLTQVSFTKPERKTRVKQKEDRAKQSFSIHRLDQYRHQIKFITLDGNTDKWLYVDLKDKHKYTQHFCDYIKEKYGYRVCAMGIASLKHIKGDKNFKPLEPFIATMKPDQKDINFFKVKVSKNGTLMAKLKSAQGIKDKFLNSMIEQYSEILNKNHSSMPESVQKLYGDIKEVKQFETDDLKLSKELSSRWPLLTELRHIDQKLLTEFVSYINAK